MNSNGGIVTLHHDAPLYWPWVVLMVVSGVMIVLTPIISLVSKKKRSKWFLAAQFGLLPLIFLGGLIGFASQHSKSRTEIQHSVEHNYTASLKGKSGDKHSAFTAKNGEKIVLTDKSGKKHECVYNFIKRTKTVEQYYIICAGSSQLLTPGKKLK